MKKKPELYEQHRMIGRKSYGNGPGRCPNDGTR
jgi:hypothetical protein